MANYRFILERYKTGGSNRYICPNCKRSHCFTRYIDQSTGDYIDDSCGKCDHNSSCGYHLTPKEYFAAHPSEPNSYQKYEHRNQVITRQETPKPTAIVEPKVVEQSHRPSSTFMQWLITQFGDTDTVQHVFDMYKLGATRDGGVIFWQIDSQQRVRTGKVMHYKDDGHRMHDKG